MDTQINCPKCNNKFPLSEAWTHDLEEQITSKVKESHKKEIEDIKKIEAARVQKDLDDKYKLDFEDLKKQLAEKDEKVGELRDHEIKLREDKRKIEEKEKELELTVERRVDEERKKAEKQGLDKATAEFKLQLFEKEKQLEATKKSLEEAQRKASQGSQQIQGEVLELDVENELIRLFPNDIIGEVAKFRNGSDVIQQVKSVKGANCGKILWECKNTSSPFKSEYIKKMKEDLLREGANVGVIVSKNLPKEAMNGMGQIEGVWVCSQALTECIATILREKLIEVAKEKWIAEHKGGKNEALISYFTSHIFIQQVQELVDVYTQMKEQISKERRLFEKGWTERDVQLQRYITSTARIVGTVQGHLGSAMPAIKGFDALELEDGQ